MWETYKDVRVTRINGNVVKRRYSVTADILSYRRCPRQYGYNGRKDFVPARPLQEFVGVIIHQVLDRAHSHFAGKIDPETKGKIPTYKEIEDFFVDTEESLKSSGIRAVSNRIRDSTLDLLQRFNHLEGPTLYPRVRDTEHRLEKDEQKFVIHGVVDVLIEDPDGDGDDVEIWDYKGRRKPGSDETSRKIIEDYEFQMLIYMYLYKVRKGKYPKKGIIYFVGELGGEVIPEKRPTNAIIEVYPDDSKLEKALATFIGTAEQIEVSINTETWDPPLGGHLVASKETCDICDFRWTCKEESKNYKDNLPSP